MRACIFRLVAVLALSYVLGLAVHQLFAPSPEKLTTAVRMVSTSH